MSQCDHLAFGVVVILIPEVRDEGQDFGRDLVDRNQRVPPRPNQAEDFQGILLKDGDLKHSTPQLLSARRPLHSLFYLILVQADGNPVDTYLSSP